MISGLKKLRKDHRDYSYPRTFGTISPDVFADELNLDAGFGFPDQNKDGRPFGCTGYAQSELCQDEDKAEYLPGYTYDKTRLIEGTYPAQVACDIRDSLNSLKVYGAQRIDETTDMQAGYHRRGAFWNVVDDPNLDAFDDIRSAMTKEQKTVSIGSAWYSEWESINGGGVVPMPWRPAASAHNWKICGWKQINGAPYLIGKSWQGPGYGDHGYHYLPREVVNYLFTQGAIAFMVRPAVPGDILTVKLALLQQVLSFCRMLLAQLL